MGKLFWLQFAISEASELATVVLSAEAGNLTPPEEQALQQLVVAAQAVATAFTGSDAGRSVMSMQERLASMKASQAQLQAQGGQSNPSTFRPGITPGPRT